MWDVPLDKLRASRLLALRMHVARYVVRAGATQRTVIAFLDEPTLATRGDLLLELLEAAGALNPQVLAMPSRGDVALPVADVLLFGSAGTSPAALADTLRRTLPASSGEAAATFATDATAGAAVPPSAGAEGAGAGATSGGSGSAQPQIWTFSPDLLLREPGPEIVDSVEAFIRIVMPEALGANGTPPAPELALRVV